MELGVRDWAYIIGGLVIVAVLLDGWRRTRSDRLSEIRVSRRARTGGGEDADQEPTNPELPGGGARVVKVREEPREQPLKPPPVSAHSVAVPRGTGRPEPAQARWKVAEKAGEPDEQVAAGDTDSAVAAAEPEPVLAAAAEDDLPPIGKPFVATRDDALLPPEIESEPEPEPEPVAEAAVQPAAASRNPAPAAAAAAKPAPQEDTGEPLELLVLHVMAPPEAKFPGREMLEILLACDLRLGSMNIFHRYEQAGGRGREQFSVVNDVEPGTFDLDNIDAFETPGVGFFMRLPGPEDPMEAFECMLETARCLVKNLDGQLLDDRHSAATGQTVEHYRQRIRDFERKQLTLV